MTPIHPRTSALALMIATLLLPGLARAQETLWPSARASHALAWHERLGQVVLYGGAPDADPRADWLWSWDGVSWTPLDTVGPGPLLHFGFAYDGDRDRLILHGGLTRPATPGGEPGRHGDTWEWDGAAWRRVSSGGPGVRDHTAMAYDPARGVVVLFGGSAPDGTVLGDTWTWDGAEWRAAEAPGPPPRSTHRLTWDAGREVVLLFGGHGVDDLLADTWAWDGATWSRLADGAEGPSARFATRAAYDAARGETVLYGGAGEGGELDDTWIRDGAGWVRRSVEGPGPRNVHAMAYDPRRERVVLFGGIRDGERMADVWEWDGAAWEQSLPD